MAIGDTDFFKGLVLDNLPRGWFDPEGEVINALANAVGEPASLNFGQIAYVAKQTRLSTASDGFLDLASEDYFGRGVMKRRKAEGDEAYRARLQAELLRPLATRAALIDMVEDLTGTPPTILEPNRQPDCGAWGGASGPYLMGYGVAGHYGSLGMPFQFFMTVTRPDGQGIPVVGPYYSNGVGSPGGYGVGAMEYGSSEEITGVVTDKEIYAAIARTVPSGVTAWVNIKSGV